MDQKLYHGIEDGRTICGPFVKFAPPLFFPYYLLFINSISMIHGLLIMSGGRPSEICQISQKRKKKKKKENNTKGRVGFPTHFCRTTVPKNNETWGPHHGKVRWSQRHHIRVSDVIPTIIVLIFFVPMLWASGLTVGA
jgi:hypothetical protein